MYSVGIEQYKKLICEGLTILIQCKENDKFKDFCNKFETKIHKSLNNI